MLIDLLIFTTNYEGKGFSRETRTATINREEQRKQDSSEPTLLTVVEPSAFIALPQES
jgi:hypothetical protein